MAGLADCQAISEVRERDDRIASLGVPVFALADSARLGGGVLEQSLERLEVLAVGTTHCTGHHRGRELAET